MQFLVNIAWIATIALGWAKLSLWFVPALAVGAGLIVGASPRYELQRERLGVQAYFMTIGSALLTFPLAYLLGRAARYFIFP